MATQNTTPESADCLGLETWLPIDGFLGYDVSDLGRVRTWRDFHGNAFGRKVPHVLKYRVLKKRGNYLAVDLSRDRKYHTRAVHVLVIRAFVGPCPDGMECRHLDGNPHNPRRDNLAYGTPTQNHADKRLHGTSNTGEQNPAAKITEATVLRVRRMLESGMTQSRVAKEVGIKQPSICGINTGKRWGHVK